MLESDLTYYQRNLPHWLPPGETIFVTFRLAGTLPRAVVENLQAEWAMLDKRRDLADDKYTAQKRYFGRYDALLDGATTGPTWLQVSAVAQVVETAVRRYHEQAAYHLQCFCLMPNHVHLLVTTPELGPPLARTLQHLKGYTAQKANAVLGRSGKFWHRESYDHIVRNATELARITSYVLENPVKAGLVAEWQQWPYTYWNEP